MHMPRFWIFDMDGTLTIPAHDFAWARQALNIPPEDDILSNVHQRTEPEREFALKWLMEWEREIAEKAQPQADAVALLNHLAERQCTIGIVTRNTKANALITLKACGFDGCFEHDDVLGRDDATPKPDPAALQYLLRRWDAKPQDAIMVGDYIHDSRAGRAAGTHTVLVMRQGPKPWEHEADRLVVDLRELITSP